MWNNCYYILSNSDMNCINNFWVSLAAHLCPMNNFKQMGKLVAKNRFHSSNDGFGAWTYSNSWISFDSRNGTVLALCWNNWQQESPPAWLQEAYCPLRSKYSLSCSVSGVYTSPSCGVPQSKLEGTAVQAWGYPSSN